jgi:CRP/FNR family transcriptional regulator, cyclic AMP receptor protein
MKAAAPLTIDAPSTGKHRNPLSSLVLTALKDIQKMKVCPEGLELFLEGQLPAGIYILYAGRVKLSVTDNHGRQVVLGMALPGDILGLSAVISGKCYEETAVSTFPSQLGFIKRRDFLRFMDHHPEAAFWVVQLLSDRVTTTIEQLSCIKHTSAKAVRQ